MSAYGQFFPRVDYDLSTEDIDIMHETAVPLFSTGEIGQSGAWANPASGKKGSITLQKIYELKGMPCRRLEYLMNAPNITSTRTIVDWCRVATGEWKVVDPSELDGG
jgi:surface antigen